MTGRGLETCKFEPDERDPRRAAGAAIHVCRRHLAVRLKQDIGSSDLEQAKRWLAKRLPADASVSASRKAGRFIVELKVGSDCVDVAQVLARSGEVRYAEVAVQHDPESDLGLAPGQWEVDVINLRAAWSRTKGDAGVLVGLADTGIRLDAQGNIAHPDLQGPRWRLGGSYAPNESLNDYQGHGTRIAGIIGAAGGDKTGMAGINWLSPIYVAKVFPSNGSACSAWIAEAFYEIADQPEVRKVINYSGGSEAGADDLRDACRSLAERNVLICAAAGGQSNQKPAMPVKYPAAYAGELQNVVAVGMCDREGQLLAASRRDATLTVLAPGIGITATAPDGGIDWVASGTSAACALVSGVASLVWSANPALTNLEVRSRLENSARDPKPVAGEGAFGAGLIDAAAAVG